MYDAQLQQQVENHGGQHHEHESRPAVERIAGGRSQAQPFEQGVRPTFQKCLHTRTRINFRASTAAAAEKPETTPARTTESPENQSGFAFEVGCENTLSEVFADFVRGPETPAVKLPLGRTSPS